MTQHTVIANQQELISLAGVAQHWHRLPLRGPAAMQAGLNKSRHKGRGLEFAEVRQYQPGDDIRSIDWKLTARSGKAHTKLYTEERERPVLILADLSTSTFFGSQIQFKSALVARASAFVAWLAKEQGDRVGGIVFNEFSHNEQRPASRQQGVLRLIHWLHDYQTEFSDLLKVQDQPGQSWSDRINQLAVLAKPGTRVFLFSDFNHLTDSSLTPLRRIAAHCEIEAFKVYDPLEADLPKSGVYTVSNGQQRTQLNTGRSKFRRQFRQDFDQRNQQLDTLFKGMGQRFNLLSTHEAFDQLIPKLSGIVKS